MKFDNASRVSRSNGEPSTRDIVPSERVHQMWRQRVVGILLVVDVIAIILVIAHVKGPVGIVVGLFQGLVIPGWSIIGRLRLESVALEIALTVATSAALIMMLSQLLETMGWWHLWLVQILWGMLFAVILGSQTPVGRSFWTTKRPTP